MNSYQNISIIIVSYKSKDKVLKFIKNISNKFNIVIIENSEDQLLKNEIELSKNIKIFLKKNIGYGSAANFARKKINTKYFLLCNPDINDLYEEKINDLFNITKKLDDNFLCLGPSYKNKIFNKNYNLLKVKKISGACMLINTKTFDLLRGFDENFFLYFEEDDLCKRGLKKRYYSYQTNKVMVDHDIGTSVTNLTEDDQIHTKELTLWHFIWSDFYFHSKHYGKSLSLIIFIPTMLRIIFKILLSYLIRNNKMNRKYKIRYSGLINSIKGLKSLKR